MLQKATWDHFLWLGRALTDSPINLHPAYIALQNLDGQ